MKKIFVYSTALWLPMLLANPVYAYLDPGTGSMIVQALIAAFAALYASIGSFRSRLRSFFGRVFGRKNSGGHESDDS